MYLTDLHTCSGSRQPYGWTSRTSGAAWRPRPARPPRPAWTSCTHGTLQSRALQPGTSWTTVRARANPSCLISMKMCQSACFTLRVSSSVCCSGPPGPYQPQGWGNGYPHWQQGQPDPSESPSFVVYVRACVHLAVVAVYVSNPDAVK